MTEKYIRMNRRNIEGKESLSKDIRDGGYYKGNTAIVALRCLFDITASAKRRGVAEVAE
jgi:hypothetical protein